MKCWLTFTGLMGVCVVFGQVKRQFNVEGSPACDDIKLTVKANSGNCFIKPSQNEDILNVFSNHDAETFSHNFIKEIKGKTCEVKLSLEEEQSNGFSQTLSTKVFGVSDNSEASDNYWKMYLTESKPYTLDLNYGVGNATVDLSGLSVRKLKINTGSADVIIGYSSMENKVDMDTFFVKVDLGSVRVKHLNLSRAKYVVADVGFGNMTMDLTDKPMGGNKVKGSVGAGNLTILLPDKETPVIIKIHNSWLCRVNLTKDLKEISEDTFANDAYLKSTKNSLSFDLDVSMGSISFK
jgi:hypothetical protein